MGKLKKKEYRKSGIKPSHNCYSYFLDEINDNHAKLCKKKRKKNKKYKCLKPQPGYAVGYNRSKKLTKKNYNCKELVKRTLADNKSIYKTTKKAKCKKNYYKGALFIDPYKDFHYYREDTPENWSHKQGRHIPSSYDAKGKPIKDPEKAAKRYKSSTKSHYYNKLCSYFCLPRHTKKNMQALPKKKFMGLFGGTQRRTRKQRIV